MVDREIEIIQVVKRFGLCGGMEEYVCRLAVELSNLGANVTILCENKVNCPELDLPTVIELGAGRKRPRWFSHLQFSRKVESWVTRNPSQSRIIHSHERISCHQVTTIHSTLFNFPPRGFPSPRKIINEYLEKREVSTKSLREIVPVSAVISEQVEQKFPDAAKQLAKPISPGVSPIMPRESASRQTSVKTIGFIGHEWKRKGLPKVLEIWRELRASEHDVNLVLAGFPVEENIGLTSVEKEEVEVLGWLPEKAVFFHKIDLLLHPASKEAYGMVIAEAASLGIPVVCSMECGASEIIQDSFGAVLNTNDPLRKWTNAVLENLSKTNEKETFIYKRDWRQVASEYLKVYAEILNN